MDQEKQKVAVNSLNWILHHKILTVFLVLLFIPFIATSGINGVIVALFLLSIILLVLGVIKPSSVKMNSRKKVIKYIGSSALLLFAIIAAIGSKSDIVKNEISSTSTGNQTQNQTVENNSNSSDTSNNINNPELTNSEAINSQTNVSNPNNQTDSSQNTDSQTTSSPDVSSPLYTVSSVTDGDTLKVNINGKIQTVRLIGMDTPETVDPRKPVQCFGKEASNKAKELLSGKKVRLETDPTQGQYDKYNRVLAYLYTEDGTFYNKYMIEQGYAHEYTYEIPYKYQAEFKDAQKSAQENKRGLWSPSTCNGDTTQSAATSSPQTPQTMQTTGGKYYTSSHSGSKYYYPESCEAWKSLSASYLQSFNSLEDLLKTYPSRIKSPQCN